MVAEYFYHSTIYISGETQYENNLKIFSAVIDKLEIIKKGVVIAKDEVETDWFRLQEELTDCFWQLQAVEVHVFLFPRILL